MRRKLTDEEELLVELIHFLVNQTGLSAREVKILIEKPMSHRKNMNCLECLASEGRAFLNELKTYINEIEHTANPKTQIKPKRPA